MINLFSNIYLYKKIENCFIIIYLKSYLNKYSSSYIIEKEITSSKLINTSIKYMKLIILVNVI